MDFVGHNGGVHMAHGLMHPAVSFFVEAGASAVEALAAPTSVSAQACRLDDRKGLLRKGYDADIWWSTATYRPMSAPFPTFVPSFSAAPSFAEDRRCRRTRCPQKARTVAEVALFRCGVRESSTSASSANDGATHRRYTVLTDTPDNPGRRGLLNPSLESPPRGRSPTAT